MSQKTLTLSANIPEDSELHDDFEKFRERTGTNSNAEAVRSLMRDGIEHQRDQSDERQESSRDVVSSQQIDVALVDSAMLPVLGGIGFLIGSDGFLAASQQIAGDTIGALLYAGIGVAIVVTMLPIFLQALRELGSDDDRTDADARAGAEA